MAEFQRFQEAPEFNPMSIIESGERVAKQGQQIIEALQTYQGQVTQRDQNLIQDSAYNQNTEVLKAFGNLSQTAAETVKTIEQQNAKNREIDEQWQAITQGIDPQTAEAEANIIQVGEEQTQIMSPTVNTVSSQNALAGEEMRQLVRVGEGLENEKVLLKTAKGTYPAFLAAFTSSDTPVQYNGKTYRAADLAKMTDPNAINAVHLAARREFIRQNGLQYTTKTNFVKILGETILNTEGYLATSTITQNIRQEQADITEQATSSIIYDSENNMARSQADVSDRFQSYVAQLRAQNTGLSNREINEKVVESMATGFILNDDLGGLEWLKTTLQVPGQKGTELGRVFSSTIQDAIVKASTADDNRDTVIANQIEQRLQQDLNTPGITREQREVLLQNAVQQLRATRSRVGYMRAEQLLGNSETLLLSPDVDLNDAQLNQQLANNNPPPLEQIRNGYLAGKYSEKAYENATEWYDQKAKGNLQQVKDVANNIKNLWSDKTQSILGYSKDEFGNLNLAGIKVGFVTAEHVAALERTFNYDFERQKDLILSTIDSDDPNVIAAELDKQLTVWVDKVTSKGGKYYMGGFWEAESFQRTGEAFEKLWKPYFDDFLDPDYRYQGTPVSKAYNTSYIPNGELPVATQYDYNPQRGDTILAYQEAERMSKEWQDGTIDPKLISIADDLGETPLAVLNESLINQGQDPVKVEKPKNIALATNVNRGAKAFEQVGFPKRSSAFLAATVAAVTGWENPTELEVETWAEGLRSLDPEAYDMIMNPTESLRHIAYAMERVFGPIPSASQYATYLTS